MYNWIRHVFNAPLFNAPAAVASSVDSGATRSPFGHTIVAVPGGDLVLIYQDGTAGLVYRVSSNGGTVWGSEIVISSRTSVYASAVINPTTKDVHVIYSKHGDPTVNDEPIYYRPLIWDSGDEDWNVGGEQQLAGGGSLYDPAVAGRRNATISVGDDSFPVITYLRNEYNTTSWAMLVSQETWALTDFNVDLDIGVTADEDSRGATVQTDDREVYFVSRTGSWYSLAYATIANPMAATGVDMTVLFSWLGSETEMVAVARNDDGDRLGIVYMAGDGTPHFRLYNIDTAALISDTEMDATAAVSVSITWDGAVFWLAWVENDNVRVSNSDAPATVVQTFSNPSPAAGYFWSWLNSPVSCVYAQQVVFAWCDTLATTFVGTFLADRAIAEDEDGAGVDEAEIGVSEDETGTGADVVTALEVIDVPDSGVGTDAESLGIAVTDDGEGEDTAGKTVTIDETGAGTDSRQLAMAVAETGTGSDDVAIIVLITPAADTGTGTDAVASLGIAVADAGEGDTDRQVGLQYAETGTGADAAIIALSESESGSGAEALTATIPVTDSGVGVDDNSVDKGDDETGTGEDSAEIAVAVAETGSGADAVGAGDTIATNVTDSGTGVDTPSVTWIPTAVILRLLMHSGEVRLKIES